jgi:outer membrane murein-binding lipoprotein Lpp
MRGSLLITGAVLAALLVPGSTLYTKAWSAETATAAELQAKVDELSKEVALLKDSIESLRREVESTKLTLASALDTIQLMKDNVGRTTQRAGDLTPEVQALSLQVEQNRENILLLRDCVLGNWYMSYYAMERAKGSVAAEANFAKYDKPTAPKFKKLENKFQDKPAGPVLPKPLE